VFKNRRGVFDYRVPVFLEHDGHFAAGGLFRGQLEKSLKLFLDEVGRVLITFFHVHDFLLK
jgi:hypothetical protein